MSKTFLTDWTQHAYENVMAANPYGCNQYGEGWKKPHDGTSTSRGADGKKRVKTSGNAQNSVDSGGKKSVHGGAMNDIDEKTRERELRKAQEDAMANYLNPPKDEAETRRKTAEIRERLERYKEPTGKRTAKQVEKEVVALWNKLSTMRYEEGNLKSESAWENVYDEYDKRRRELKNLQAAEAKEKGSGSTYAENKGSIDEARRKRDELNAAYWEKRKAYQARTGSGIGRPDFDQTKEGRAALDARVKQYDVVKQLERENDATMQKGSTYAGNKKAANNKSLDSQLKDYNDFYKTETATFRAIKRRNLKSQLDNAFNENYQAEKSGDKARAQKAQEKISKLEEELKKYL